MSSLAIRSANTVRRVFDVFWTSSENLHHNQIFWRNNRRHKALDLDPDRAPYERVFDPRTGEYDIHPMATAWVRAGKTGPACGRGTSRDRVPAVGSPLSPYPGK